MVYLPLNAFVILLGLFVLLSPGLLLTIPGLSIGQAQDLGVAYLNEPSTVVFCDPSTVAQSECKKPSDVFVSGYTYWIAVLVHTVVFAAVLYFLIPALNIPAFSGQAIVVFSLLFGVLAPGLIFTLPGLTAAECGQTGKRIADVNPAATTTTLYCEGLNGFAPGTSFNSTNYPNCAKCTSWVFSGQTNLLPILVHAVVFGILVYYIAQYIN